MDPPRKVNQESGGFGVVPVLAVSELRSGKTAWRAVALRWTIERLDIVEDGKLSMSAPGPRGREDSFSGLGEAPLNIRFRPVGAQSRPFDKLRAPSEVEGLRPIPRARPAFAKATARQARSRPYDGGKSDSAAENESALGRGDRLVQ